MGRNTFLIAFAIILVLDLVVTGTEVSQQLRFITKPSITLSLLIYLFYNKEVSKHVQKFLALGLIFSLFGDVLLLFTGESQNYFIGGLLAFLIAHTMYILAFFHKGYVSGDRIVKGVLFLAVYALSIFYFIGPHLGELFPYVIAYMLVLLIVVLIAYVRKSFVNSKSYYFVFFGAISFVISDSILALNKFYDQFAISGILVMLTYGMAQFLIVFGGISEKSST